MAVILKLLQGIGRARRRLYKPERDRWAYHKDGRRYFDTARARAWVPDPGVKLTEADLTAYEAGLGCRAVGQNKYHMRVGRILDYDRIGNQFLVVGKPTYKGPDGLFYVDESEVVERWLPGRLVSSAVVSARVIAGRARLERGADDVPGVDYR